VFTVFKSTSYCSIVDGDIVEAMTNGRDISGKTSPIDVCFSGWWWQKKLPAVYTIDTSPSL
jgi:hypothetical protein